mgnify:CR=1 FL=1
MMIRLLKTCLLGLSLAILPAFATVSLQSLLNNIQSMQASFEQTTIGQSHQVSYGNVAIQKPGKFRWEITKPQQQIILANGKTVTIYNVALQQATIQNQTQQIDSPAALLSGDNENRVSLAFGLSLCHCNKINSHGLKFSL